MLVSLIVTLILILISGGIVYFGSIIRGRSQKERLVAILEVERKPTGKFFLIRTV
jgi:hypothetical protein